MNAPHALAFSRRRLLAQGALAAGASLLLPRAAPALGIEMDAIPRGERPPQDAGAAVLNPRGRVPVSFIIDDSTCLVNMAHFGMPQFGEAWPDRDDYKKDWKSWPREIPDSFVRKFGEWCRTQGVKGKYSVVPYPSCVGWVDRVMPGWSAAQLRDSLKLVRDFMAPDWDIHPEMISHTRVIDLKTGRPFAEISRHTMENSHPAQPVTVDHFASYIAYALRVLKNADLPVDGFTTPGGFGNLMKSELSLAAIEAVREVCGSAVPHYFKYLVTEKDGSTQPRVEHASGLGGDDPRCCVNVIGGTGDWFGGWDGVTFSGSVDQSADRFITADLKAGRMVEMIEKGEPAIMLCHWPGIYCNGDETGFQIFQKAITRVNAAFADRIAWMKLSEIATYWAAKELTKIEAAPAGSPYPRRSPRRTSRSRSKRAPSRRCGQRAAANRNRSPK
ncbi:MAG: hypothetical protein R3F11_24130 [Verrucomicrobiales bacterium]